MSRPICFGGFQTADSVVVCRRRAFARAATRLNSCLVSIDHRVEDSRWDRQNTSWVTLDDRIEKDDVGDVDASAAIYNFDLPSTADNLMQLASGDECAATGVVQAAIWILTNSNDVFDHGVLYRRGVSDSHLFAPNLVWFPTIHLFFEEMTARP